MGGFGFSLGKGIVIEDILVRDQRDTVLFSTHQLAVQPDWKKLAKGSFHIRKALVDGGAFQLIQYKGDSLLNLEFIIDYFSSGDTMEKPRDTTGKPFSVTGSSVVVRNFRFHYQDCNQAPVTDGMDYANIDVSDIHLNFSRFSVRGDTISADISSLMARERSGFELLSFSGDASVSSRFVIVENMKALTQRSDLDLDLAMTYDGYPSFLDFIRKVTIKGDIRPSLLNLADIGYFAPEVKSMDNPLRIEGSVEGTVDRFRADGMKVRAAEGTHFTVDLMAAGLPDIYKTYVDLTVRDLTTTAKDLRSFRLPADPSFLDLPEEIDRLGVISLKGRFTGFWDAFNADFTAGTDIGTATANLDLKRVSPGGAFTYNGQVEATSLNAGRLTGAEPLLGRATIRGDVRGSGLDLRTADLTMNLAIDSLYLNGYNYQKIAVNGSLSDMEFNGLLSFRDPNLRLDFNGRADLRDSLPDFDFDAIIHYAQLFRLNLMERDSVENVSGGITARFTGNNIDNLEGEVHLKDFAYTEGEHTADFKELLLKTSKDPRGNKSFHLESDYLNADLTGVFLFSNMIASTEVFIRNYLASFNLKDSLRIRDEGVPQVMRFILEFGETREVTDIFLPFLHISPGTILSGYFDTQQDIIRMEGNSPLIEIYGTELENWSLEAESTSSELQLTTGCDHFYISRSSSDDSLDIRMDELSLASSVRHDSILYDIGWVSGYGHSFINGTSVFPEDGSVRLVQDQFSVWIKNNIWHLSPDNLVVIDASGVSLHNLDLTSRDQQMKVDGVVSDHPDDTLMVSFDNLNVSDLDYFLGNPDIDMDGVLSGTMKLRNLTGDLRFVSDLRLEKFRFNKELLGDAMLEVDYDDLQRRFDIDARVIYTGNIGQNIPVAVTGSYQLGNQENFDFDINLKNLNLKMIEPFVSDLVPRIRGLVSGDAHLSGTPEDPELTGQIKLQRTEFVIGYLNVPYSLSDVVTIEPEQFVFNDITLYDSVGNKAYLNGKITHNHFRDFLLDLDILMEDFSAFTNTFAQNSIFYGNARATGDVSLTGPFDNIRIAVHARTGSKTHVVIPINLTEDVGQMNYILFEEPDTARGLVVIPSAAPEADFPISLDLNLAISPDAEVEVFLPDQLGNLKASGTGNLTMTMTPTTPFTIKGSYVISKGSFLLQLRNLLRLPFTISEGSQIGWSGDPADADIRLSASYRTKVPLAGLTTDPEVASSRVMVECILRLKGKLMNPQYEFGMNIPNAEESVKRLVFNSIDTTNQLEMSKQVLSVLMLNQFNPVAGTTAGLDVSGTSMSIVTNQINSMLSRMTGNVNVNLNYQPGSSTTGQEFDVGLSTQFLNDRLLIDGTFGMTSYKNAYAQQTNTIVGDINIEYVLTKNRRWRIRAFNRTNTLDILYNNSPYTQGIGISYQREFGSFRDLFTKKSDKDK